MRFRASSAWFQPVWGPCACGQQFSSVVSASCRNDLGTCAGLSLCLSGNWGFGDSARWGIIARFVLCKPRTYISAAETELIAYSCGSPFTERFASRGLRTLLLEATARSFPTMATLSSAVSAAPVVLGGRTPWLLPRRPLTHRGPFLTHVVALACEARLGKASLERADLCVCSGPRAPHPGPPKPSSKVLVQSQALPPQLPLSVAVPGVRADPPGTGRA